MAEHQPKAPKANILVVDDTPSNLRLLRGILLTQGYDIQLADNGAVALQLVQSACPDLILLDIMMPDMDGYAVCEQLKADEHSRDIPVIFLSALDEMRDKMKAFSAGGVDYITRPFQVQEVLARVDTHLALRNLQKRLQKQNLSLQEENARRQQAEMALQQANEALEERVQARTSALKQANRSLTAEITERKQVEEALRESEERHRTVLESAPEPVVVYDKEGRVRYFNPAFSRVFGWTLSESEGHTIEFVSLEHLPEARLIFEKITHGKTVSGIETFRLTKDGISVPVSISGAGFFDSQSMLQGSVITIQDITERKQREEETWFIANHDVLTGLPNRRSFYMCLEDELIQSHSQTGGDRRVKGAKWALLFLDLDKFKDINDTLGHDAGDELLQVVADRLKHCIRKNDYIFRLGGDEFTVLLNALVHDIDVAKVVEKIRKAVAQPYCIKGHELYVTVSIGISIYPDDGEDVETLVKNVDMAMYAAKEEGQGYHFFTEEMNRKALERIKLESSLRTALQDNQFVVYYQPIVDDETRIVGMEALLRWSHPELGVVNPAQFIPVAEEIGAIVSIGKWVLYTVCQQARTWHDKGYEGFYMAVNLSARQFKEPDLVEMVEETLEATGLPPDCLKLEVTESSIMENPEQAIAKMELLRARGIHFSIDDFGTGYSSLGYLKRFPVDTLKIDRSFVMEASTNKDDQEIIKTIISMAHNLKMKTVAEGVETQDQQDFLTRQGCHMTQGYYHGRPMPADKFEEILQTRKIPREEKD